MAMRGDKEFVKRDWLRLMQRLVASLGGQVTQQALKGQVARWLPGARAMAMAAWASHGTEQVERRADQLFREGPPAVVQGDRAEKPPLDGAWTRGNESAGGSPAPAADGPVQTRDEPAGC
jgi:hypothetical protein